MAHQLPYLSNPGSLDKALPKIKEAARPERFTGDFASTVVQIKGGSGRALIPFFKKIGFLKGDGTPSEIYERFRNRATSGTAMADAIRHGYKALYRVNEYAHKLNDADLKGAIVQVTGLEPSNNTVNLVLRTFKRLAAQAKFDGASSRERAEVETQVIEIGPTPPTLGLAAQGLNLSYTLNLNLPATTNVEVFNAIFRSLRENLLADT